MAGQNVSQSIGHFLRPNIAAKEGERGRWTGEGGFKIWTLAALLFRAHVDVVPKLVGDDIYINRLDLAPLEKFLVQDGVPGSRVKLVCKVQSLALCEEETGALERALELEAPDAGPVLPVVVLELGLHVHAPALRSTHHVAHASPQMLLVDVSLGAETHRNTNIRTHPR